MVYAGLQRTQRIPTRLSASTLELYVGTLPLFAMLVYFLYILLYVSLPRSLERTYPHTIGPKKNSQENDLNFYPLHNLY